ncbi:hypothetical protein EIP91_011085 [Steccherinum ochraceum]|uniref:Uncharacterized protein n=1 Tax=Steccherinum ochraceum TaxID=92696 RepID=A0A4R0S3K1_9APHY|nr:hypothetical protein EIP91_011085 [Steccherinum ochraceum]
MLQIIPTASNGVDAVNFRQMRESSSLNLETQHTTPASSHPSSPNPSSQHIKAVAGQGTPGTPGFVDDGIEPPLAHDADLFGAFTSMTIHATAH